MSMKSLYAALAAIPLMGSFAQAQQLPKSYNPLGDLATSSSFVGDNKRIRILGDKAILRITGYIDEKMAAEISEDLDVFEANESNKSKTLEVRINSYGGELEAGTAIADRLAHLQNKVITIGEGKVMSAGFLIFTVPGKERHSYPNTWFMHHPSTMPPAKEDATEQEKKMVQESQEVATLQTMQLMQQYKHSGKLSKQQVKAMFSGEDCYFSADFAHWAGFVTHILEPGGRVRAEVMKNAPRVPERCPPFVK